MSDTMERTDLDLTVLEDLDPSQPCGECAPEVIREADWAVRCKGCGHMCYWCDEHMEVLRRHVAVTIELASMVGGRFDINCRMCGIKGPTIESVMEYWRRR